MLLKNSEIKKIFTTGKTADKYYQKYIYPTTKIKSICLPSTSPANCQWKMEELLQSWAQILEDLK